ncbi:MAG TPA: amino acid adenylation domain-containing protein [Thermoanaerobaculia bacterium]|nr:amino acid adenylation domain-containing protein [Thermoanaerobaculia bacterium]
MTSKQTNIEDIYALSPSQQGMLFHLLFGDEKGQVYFDQYVSTLAGPLDRDAWRRAWTQVMERHAALRTQFVWERREQPLQVVRRGIELPWQELDWRDLPEAEREERFAAFLQEDHDRGFDLTKAPLMRCAVIRFADAEARFVWSFHHLVVDGWSMGVILGEVFSLYQILAGGGEPQIARPRPFRDYIAWVQKQDPARAEDFWRRTLRGLSTANPLPFDGTGAGGDPTGWVSREEILNLSPELTETLRTWARQNQLTLNTLVQGAWALLLGRYSGADSVTFGGIVAGRPTELDGVESMVGLFINALPVRVPLPAEEPVAAWLKALQEQQTEQREFEHSPIDQILGWSEVGRKGKLFETMLVFENYPMDAMRTGAAGLGLEIRKAHLSESGNFPLTLYVVPKGSVVELRLAYHWTRMSRESALRILDHLETLLRNLGRPGARLRDLAILAPEERRELLAAGQGPRTGAPEATVLRRFEEQAARTPSSIAVESKEGLLTYAELDRRATSLARYLRQLGVGPESIVGLHVERSLDMLVGRFGVWKAGGAYLPLDPAYPAERLAFMLEDSGARVVLTQGSLEAKLPASNARVVRLDADWPAVETALPEADLANVAYVIYTSGSTGRPKGVLVPHATLANYVRVAVEAYGIGPADRVLQFASISFDTSAEEIDPALATGATLVLRDEEMASSVERFAREAGERGITVLDLPTAYWHELVAEGVEMPPSLRLVILGGEAAQVDRLSAWRERVGERVRLMNSYGPTEATIVSTHRDLTHGIASAEVPIGRAIANARTAVVDRNLELAPWGIEGELLIGGAGVTRGYLGRPGLTAERFVPDPFGAEPGARLYRSGDLARLLPDGDLEFRGRADDQVKVRGFRIELGEIEAALRRLEGVRDAVVAAREDGPAGKRLVAYVVPAGEKAPSVADLRNALKDSLPEYMVPSAFVVLESLPVTPSGKVDRRALPAPDSVRPDLDAHYQAPHTPVQEMLAEIWSDLLGVERIGIHDDFFQLGGHSLLVAKLAARVRQAFKVELSLIDAFKSPTIAELAERIEKPGSGAEFPELPPIRRADRSQPIPLSFPQERVWFLDQLTAEGGNIAYNFQVTIWFQGPLRVDVFERTLAEIVRRHEVLRTSFPGVDGRPIQVIHEPWPVALPVIDLRAVPEDLRREESERLVFESTQKPFDVAEIPLIRWRMLRLAEDLWELIQVEQHFVHDGWSFGVMLKEIKAIYPAFLEGLPSPLPELPVQYADFAAWQRELMEGPAMEPLLGYWTRKLAGASTVLELPTDRPRPNRPSFAGDITLYRLPVDLYGNLRSFCRREGFTLYMTMLAGFFSLLHRYTGQEDVLLGTNNANRRAHEIELIIGMIVNTLVVRGDLSGDPDFKTLLSRAREVSLETYAHQDMPFERLVQELRPERQPGRNPLFQVMFNFHDAAIPDLEFGGLEGMFRVRGNRSAKMDMNVIVVPGAEQRVGLEASELDRRAVLHWEYNTDLFDFATVERMIGHYLTLLAGVIENPLLKLSELPVLTGAERRQLLVEWNDTGAPVPAGTLPELVQGEPEAVAVSFEGTALTYGELDARSNRLAHHLRRLGVGAETLVGLCVERSPDLLVGMLGVLKAGGAYVPLDPTYPADRLAYVVEDAKIPVLLTQSALHRSLGLFARSSSQVVEIDGDAFAGESADKPSPLAGPENRAYVIYTSGSTGRPKGVEVRHRGAVSFLASMARQPGISRDDVLVAVTTLSFDIALLELFLPLTVGARIELASRETAADGERLAALIASSGATVMQATPATWRVLLESGWEGAPGLKVLCGGEALPRDLADALLARVGSLWNVYGPTETTVWSAVHPVAPGTGPVPIGRPIANTTIHILDRTFTPVPANIWGELWIGGDGLARGYLGRPDLTAERFLPDPFAAVPGSRLYRTGDVARRLRNGDVEFAGRADHQVKVRGFRIELGEIEAALAEHPGVRRAVVAVREPAAGERRLVAWVVPEGEAPPADELRAYLRDRLPEYMVPGQIVTVSELPLTPNGKVDRKALPDPDPGHPAAAVETPYVEPRNEAERILASVWAQVLRVEKIGIHDNFFSLGGDSILIIRVVVRCRKEGVRFAPAQLFQHQTIAALSRVVDASGLAGETPEIALTPFMRRVLESEKPERWNEAVLVALPPGVGPEPVRAALQTLLDGHDSLRLRFRNGRPEVAPAGEPVAFETVNGLAAALEIRDRLDVSAGPLLRAAFFVAGDAGRLLLSVHRLVADGPTLAGLLAALPFGEAAPALRDEGGVSVVLGPEETRAVLETVPELYGNTVEEVLLAAMAQAFGRRLEVDVELDVPGGTGCSTVDLAVRLEPAEGPGEALKGTKERLREALRHVPAEPGGRSEVSFRFRGRLGAVEPLPAGRPEAETTPLAITAVVAGGRLRVDWTWDERVWQTAAVRSLAEQSGEALLSFLRHAESPEAGGFTPSDFLEAGLDQRELDDLLAEL